MPKSEAEIARPYQVELAKAQQELDRVKKESAKSLAEVEENHRHTIETYQAQIEELEEKMKEFNQENLTDLRQKISEGASLHEKLFSDFEVLKADHLGLEEQLKEAITRATNAELSNTELRKKVEALKEKIPKANEPGRPRTRRSQRT